MLLPNARYQSSAGCELGKQLKDVCELFRTKSSVLSESLATVVKFAAGQSSVIQTIPFKATVVLNELLGDNCTAVTLSARYSAVIRSQLSGLDGQPYVAILLQEICTKADACGRVSRSHSVLRDCDVVLSFIRYLCDIVQLAFVPDARARLIALATEEMAPGAPTAHQVPPGDDEDDTAHRDYDFKEFYTHGVHAPWLRKLRERGKFPKDTKSDQERANREGGCDKSFEKKKNKTGTPQPASSISAWVYLLVIG